jgi:class 3 adenylate cyclase
MMTDQLDEAYNQLKKYALHAVIAHKKEMRIRNIFQKYVPTDVIDTFFANPESMLVGENRVLSILFSDVRSFTTISEGLAPDDLVNSLNKYFEMMVDVILSHNGIVDKYIGDAIMAFFGAPVKHDDDPLQSVKTALDMMDKLKEFNRWEKKQGRSEFKIGIGINYGVVTVGNIGSEKKMDYTVIGDMVNLASRLEGLTKKYKESIIISGTLYHKIKGEFPCRMIDKVIVKGKSKGVDIYSVYRSITPEIKTGWDYFYLGQEHYYKREFKKGFEYFRKAQDYIPDDFMSKIFEDRSAAYMLAPPDSGDWTGETILEEK